MKYFIAVAGNIGAGKTTISRLLADRFQIEVHCEKFAGNPYLSDFYLDKKKWSFHSQIYFLTQNFKAHLTIQDSKNSWIQDRTIYEDSEIFAQNLFLQGNFKARDYQCYQELYASMVDVLKYPDLVIYLRASPNVLMNRINKRQRDFEREMDFDYIAQLNIMYDRWIRGMMKKNKVLIVETDQLNIFGEENSLEQIYNGVRKSLNIT